MNNGQRKLTKVWNDQDEEQTKPRWPCVKAWWKDWKSSWSQLSGSVPWACSSAERISSAPAGQHKKWSPPCKDEIDKGTCKSSLTYTDNMNAEQTCLVRSKIYYQVTTSLLLKLEQNLQYWQGLESSHEDSMDWDGWDATTSDIWKLQYPRSRNWSYITKETLIGTLCERFWTSFKYQKKTLTTLCREMKKCEAPGTSKSFETMRKKEVPVQLHKGKDRPKLSFYIGKYCC